MPLQYLSGLFGSISNILPHEPMHYLVVLATIFVWSLHFVLRRAIYEMEDRTR